MGATKIFMFSPRARAAVFLAVLVWSAACLAGLPDKAAPFTAVQWEGEDAIVRVDGEWFYFEGLDDLAAPDIIGYAMETYGDRWQKRFSEDLVEVLAGMGYTPGEVVNLSLRKDGVSEVRAAEMTEENRKLAWRYNQDKDEAHRQAARSDAGATAAATAVESADPNQQVARQMAQHMDRVWDQSPAAGTANIRVLFERGGEPYAGVVSVQTEFAFSARGHRGLYISQGLNPNANGRWVYEGLEPGIYNLTITGNGPREGWSWSQDGVEVSAGEAPLFEISLDQ